jgi:hypothetical protein
LGGYSCAYKLPPKDLPGFPDAKRVKPKTLITKNGKKKRRRWRTPDGTIFEWDYRHGTVEKHDKQGNHQGEFRPNGTKIGPARNRKIQP